MTLGMCLPQPHQEDFSNGLGRLGICFLFFFRLIPLDFGREERRIGGEEGKQVENDPKSR